MGAPTAALAAFQIAVRGGSTALTGAELIGVHGKAHRTPGKTPFEPRLLEDIGQPLFLGLGADKARSGHDHGAQTVLDLLAFDDRGGGAQVFDPAIGAGADEDRVDL